MTIVAEVSAVIETASLVAKIGRLRMEFPNFIDVLEEMDCWKKSLEDLQMYAGDAETKQANDELVWKWLKDLEAMRLDIEDVIADLQYESMRREASRQRVSGSGVQNQLMEELKGTKFLIILDDLWNDKKPDWDLLMAALRGGSAGSKVIVTTRSRHVADMARTVEKYPVLGPVPFEDCWELFCSKVGVSRKGELEARMEKAGKEIVRSCNSVPLAAAILGGVLRNKEKLQYWEAVRDKKSLRSKEGEFDMMSVMRLSYNDLPGKLKRCFALLAVFPEGHVVSWDDMEQLWSAEELIECGEIGTGRSYDFVEELVARSFLITNDTDTYVMHDMVRDLACEVAGVSCCVVDDYSIKRIEEIYKKGQTRLCILEAVYAVMQN